MRFFLTLILLPQFFLSYANPNVKPTYLKIWIGNCKDSTEQPYNYVDTVSLYRMPSGKLVYKYVVNRTPDSIDQTSKLEVGRYKITFTNQFHQPIEKNVELLSKDTNHIRICQDELASYPANTLGKLKDLDSITLLYNSSGCFSTQISRLVIVRKRGLFLARLYRGELKKSKDGHPKAEYGRSNWKSYFFTPVLNVVTLNRSHLTAFAHFENELTYVDEGGCTTVDNYVLNSNYLKISKEDGSCHWNGFDNLCTSIFGEAQYNDLMYP